MKTVLQTFTGALVLTLSAAAIINCGISAQGVDDWTSIQQLQADLKADRQAVVARNLPLTDGESRLFWPVYQQYRGELAKHGDRLVKLVAAYAANYESMDDPKPMRSSTNGSPSSANAPSDASSTSRRSARCCRPRRPRDISRSRTRSTPS